MKLRLLLSLYLHDGSKFYRQKAINNYFAILKDKVSGNTNGYIN